ncbi:hypothetical protein HOP50_15g75700 [Chloropicon primus]|uniref:Uncharacterized protein n=1 Tax=Chloropicon primus TaxID=1764295 RepID=A0A5B8MX10_9CHLO|nr:hypothetical protein A3770_15p75450 [Chloropicon primus]UPR04235.1 hypothetical protein HOP50_15g75700 [Chloropicon primus]|eukprot:QDZ25027.1 hypothetical protein A3770_15p75450 [Chloropicon primus]
MQMVDMNMAVGRGGGLVSVRRVGSRGKRRRVVPSVAGGGDLEPRGESARRQSAASPLDAWMQSFISKNVRGAFIPQRCMECVGSGLVVCECCQGRGKVGGLLEGGKGTRCPRCEGDGCVDCGECKATGIRNNWLFQPAEDPGWGPRGEP